MKRLRIFAALIVVLPMIMSAALAQGDFTTQFLEVNGTPFTDEDYDRQIPVVLENTAKGMTENIPDGKHLWLMVHPQESQGFWPQTGEIHPHPRTKKWTHPFRIGYEGGDIGKVFDVVLVLVNQEIHEAFVRYLEEGAKTGEFPGNPLPSGAQTVDQMTVRKDRDY